MNRIVVFFLIVGSLLPATAEAGPAHAKLSPHLQMLTSSNPDLVEIAKQHVHLKTEPENAEPILDTLVLFRGDPKVFEALGARIHSVLGNVATVDIPVSALEMIANHPNLVRIEESKRLKPRLDVSVPEAGANGVWGNSTRPLPPPWTGNTASCTTTPGVCTGRNVVVGLVDTGIDLNHTDFKDSFGKSRVLYVWDQTVDGFPPTGFSYGNECTKQQTDAGTCSQTDTDGHGTHVMGIAAGNGSATGNSQPSYRYIGMAPEANLIVVKSTFFDSDIINGITYIQNKAAALSLPSVINLSLGFHFGPHDGTSLLETALDAASGPGKMIVAAAGNEAADQIHASGTVINGTVGPTVGFSVPTGSSDVLLDLWYPGIDQIGVNVTSPSANCIIPFSGFRYPGNTTVVSNTACGRVTITTPGTDSINGDHEIIIELRNTFTPVEAGIWTFTLTGRGCGSSRCVANGTFDVWVDDVTSSATFVDHIDPAKTVDMPATATKVIAAASYVTKNCWLRFDGQLVCYSPKPQVGDISSFSSRGPRRTCSNTANCPATQKPELAAPGQGITSAKSASSVDPIINNPDFKDPDGVHVLAQGTSMSTPHVTGAVALMLAQNATLTSDQVKAALTANGHTRTDSFTGSTPNNTWGYGKLAIDQAITSVVSNNPPSSPTPTVPTGVSAVAGPGSATISWDGIANDIYLDGYNVYRSTTSGRSYAKANLSIVTTNSFTVTGLTAGTLYFFVVTSLDTPGVESANSMEVTATPAPAPNSGGCGAIDLSQGRPSNPSEAISYLLPFFLPLVLIRIFRRHRAGTGVAPISSAAFDDQPCFATCKEDED